MTETVGATGKTAEQLNSEILYCMYAVFRARPGTRLDDAGADRSAVAAEVDALLDRHAGPCVVVVPDRHGTGTNALLLEPPDAIRPAFGPGSRERHLGLAAGAVVDEVPGLLLDVDTPEDLAALHEARR